MDNAVRGTKRRCPHCGAPFYDLNRSPIVCPKCDAEVRPEAIVKAAVRAPRGQMRAVRPAPVAEDAEAFEEDEVLPHEEGEDEDEAAIDETEDVEEPDETRE